jgi:hypothetical protein
VGFSERLFQLFHPSRQFFHGIDQHKGEGRTVVDPEVLHIGLAVQATGHPPDHFGKDLFDFLAEHADALLPRWGAGPAVVAEAHRSHSPQLGEPGF